MVGASEGNNTQTFVTSAVTTFTSYPDSTVACTKQEVKCDGCPIRTTSQICIDPRDPDSLITTITKTIDCTGKITQTQFNIAPRFAPGRGVTIVQNAPPSAPNVVPCSNSQGGFVPCTQLKQACNSPCPTTSQFPLGTMTSEPCVLAQGGIPHLHLKPNPFPDFADSRPCICPPLVTASSKQSEGCPGADQRSGPGEITMCACPSLIPPERKTEPETECGCPRLIPAMQQKSCPIIPEHIHIRSIPCGIQEPTEPKCFFPNTPCPPPPCLQPRFSPFCRPSVPNFPLPCSPPPCPPPLCSPSPCSPPPCSQPPCSQPVCSQPCLQPASITPSCMQPVSIPPSCMQPSSLTHPCVQPTCLPPSCMQPTSLPPSCMQPTSLPPSCMQHASHSCCMQPATQTCAQPNSQPYCVQATYCRQPPCFPRRSIVHAQPYCLPMPNPPCRHWPCCGPWPPKEATNTDAKKEPSKTKDSTPAPSQPEKSGQGKTKPSN